MTTSSEPIKNEQGGASTPKTLLQICLEEEAKLKEMYLTLAETANTTQEKLVMQLLTTKIAQVEQKEDWGRKRSHRLRISSLVLSTLATIALGLKLMGKTDWLQWQADIALILSAGVTLLTAIATFLDVDGYRLHVRIMLEKLKILRYRYAFLLATTPKIPPNNASMEALMQEFVGIVGDGYWEKLGDKPLLPKDLDKLVEEVVSNNLKAIKDAIDQKDKE